MTNHTNHRFVKYTRLHRRKLFCLMGAVLLFALLNSFLVLFVHVSETRYILWVGSERVREYDELPFVNFRLAVDVDKYVSQLISGVKPDMPPFNLYHFPYIIANKDKCVTSDGTADEITLLLIIKSAVTNFETRNAVRKTWGWEERFPKIKIMRIFNLGVHSNDTTLQELVMAEQSKHGDLIQGNFKDSYFNNTIKTMMSFRWAIEICPTAKFIMFVDDDMYVSMKNVLQFLNRPEGYPTYENSNYTEEKMGLGWQRVLKFSMNEPPASFFAGYVKPHEAPQRNLSAVSRKWYMPLSQYPYKVYPPYVPAGAFIISYPTLRRLYYFSMYTPHFKFDDIYLGMVTKRAGITLTHSDHFVYRVKNTTDYKNAIAIHDYRRNTEQLISLWQKQHNMGYA